MGINSLTLENMEEITMIYADKEDIRVDASVSFFQFCS